MHKVHSEVQKYNLKIRIHKKEVDFLG